MVPTSEESAEISDYITRCVHDAVGTSNPDDVQMFRITRYKGQLSFRGFRYDERELDNDKSVVYIYSRSRDSIMRLADWFEVKYGKCEHCVGSGTGWEMFAMKELPYGCSHCGGSGRRIIEERSAA